MNIHIFSSKGNLKEALDVKLAISHRVYWKPVDNNDDAVPTTLFDFRKESSLELTRIESAENWDKINEAIMPDDTHHLGVVVHGRLHVGVRYPKKLAKELLSDCT